MLQNIKVKEFENALLEKLNGYDDFEILSIGKVQGDADGLINPYVMLLKDSTGRNQNIYLPSFED